jgi:hypothetical protein
MNLGSIFTAIGDSGSQVAEAKMKADQYKIDQLFNQLGLKQGQAQLEETQARTKKIGAPVPTPAEKMQQDIEGIEKVLGRKLTESEKSLYLGVSQPAAAPKTPPITNKLEAWRAAFIQEHKREPTTAEIEGFDQKERPDKAVKVSMTGDIATQVTDADGKTWRAHDPNLPPELAAIVKDHEDAAMTSEKKKATLEAQKTAEAINKAIKIGDVRAQQKEYQDIWKIAQRGINGHGFLRTVSQEVAAAEAGGGKGTKFGDMNIAEGFMQLMFGLNPKALRGSPQMLESILKESGGWDDRAIAEMNKALTGGRLSQDVRNDILEKASRQVEAWDQQVRQTAAMTDDPKVRALMDKYSKQVTGDVDEEIKKYGGKPQ